MLCSLLITQGNLPEYSKCIHYTVFLYAIIVEHYNYIKVLNHNRACCYWQIIIDAIASVFLIPQQFANGYNFYFFINIII